MGCTLRLQLRLAAYDRSQARCDAQTSQEDHVLAITFSDFGCGSRLYISSLHGTAEFEIPDLSKLHAEDQEDMHLDCAPYVFSYTG